jgi:hypothetical protein
MFLLPSIFAATFQMEWDTQTISSESWTKIDLTNYYLSPVIVATPEYSSTTRDNGIIVWLRNVSGGSFEVYVGDENGNAADNVDVHFVVMEEGSWTMPVSGIKVEAGKVATNKVGSSGGGNYECPVHGEVVNFDVAFDSNPIVLVTRGSTENAATWATAFAHNETSEDGDVSTTSMCVGLSQANAASPGAVTDVETVYYIAADEGTGDIGGADYEIVWANSWIDGHDDGRPFSAAWAGAWTGTPDIVLGSQTSMQAGEGSWPVVYDTGNTGNLRMFVDEANGRSHLNSESGGGWAFNESGAYGNVVSVIDEPYFNTSLIVTDDNISLFVNVTDAQGDNTIDNVSCTILYPDSSRKNFSLYQALTTSKMYNGTDFESGEESKFSIPDDTQWLEGWSYRKTHVVEGSSYDNATNYTMRFVIYNKTGTDFGQSMYVGAKAQADFDDIRFTNSTRNASGLYPYWLERYGSDYAVFWVKVDYIPQNDNLTMYVYYGNSSVSNAGDGAKAFLYFEDFESYGAQVDNTLPVGWNDYGTGDVRLDTDAGNRVLIKTNNNDPNGGWVDMGVNVTNYKAIWKTNRVDNTGGNINRYGIERSGANGYSTYSNTFGSNMRFRIERRTNGGAADITAVDKYFATEIGTWYRMSMSYFNTDLKHAFMDMSETVFESAVATDGVHTWFDRFYIHGGWHYWTDDILLMNYMEPEPQHGGWGDEETWKNEVEGNTLYTYYGDVDSTLFQKIGNITVNIDLSAYDDSGSVSRGNNDPVLQVDIATNDMSGLEDEVMSNGKWLEVGNFILNTELNNREIGHVLKKLKRGQKVPRELVLKSFEEKVAFKVDSLKSLTADKIVGEFDNYIKTRMEIERDSIEAKKKKDMKNMLSSLEEKHQETIQQ